jgi:serine/threonine protein kinase
VGVAQRLSHPNIIKFYRAGELEGRYFVALECIEGEMLSVRLERKVRFKELEALRIGREMAYALYHSHVLGLLLRDVRPENVIVEPTGRSRFADVGVGKVNSDDPRLIACGLAVESPHYQSPEQIRGTMVVGRRSDLYGLGATLYHMLTGQPPFVGPPEEVREKIVSDPPRDPREVVPEINPLTRDLVLQLLAKDPEQRVKRADGVIEVIDRVLGGALQQMRSTPGAHPTPVPVRPPTPAAPLLEELEEEPAPEPPRPRPSGRTERKSQKRISGRRKKV